MLINIAKIEYLPHQVLCITCKYLFIRDNNKMSWLLCVTLDLFETEHRKTLPELVLSIMQEKIASMSTDFSL